MNSDSEFFNLGVKLGAFNQGVDASDLPTVEGLVRTIEDPSEPGYGDLQRLMCKYAAQAFEEAGKGDTWACQFFHSLSKAANWYPELEMFSDAVIKAAGTVYKEALIDQADRTGDSIVKNAAGFLPNAAGKAVAMAPGALKAFAGAGVAGGAGLGALWWLMNRHSQEDENSIEALKAKLDFYDKLTNEIQNEVKSTGPGSTGDVRDVVQDLI